MLASGVQKSDSVIHISILPQILSPYWLLQNIVLSSFGKESACNAWDPGSIPGSGRSAEEGIGYPLQYSWASLVAQLVKESACNEGDLGSVPRLGRSPGEGKGYPPGEFHGLYNQWGCKESDTTECKYSAYAVHSK